MANYNRVTAKDKLDLYECFEAGLKNAEIMELTGRSVPTITRIRKLWKEEREVPDIPVEKTEPVKTETDMAESDYAKAYLSGDPARCNTNLDIKRTISIESRKTGIRYKMSEAGEIMIVLPDGSNIKMDLKVFEKFADESIDVYIEAKQFAKCG